MGMKTLLSFWLLIQLSRTYQQEGAVKSIVLPYLTLTL